MEQGLSNLSLSDAPLQEPIKEQVVVDPDIEEGDDDDKDEDDAAGSLHYFSVSWWELFLLKREIICFNISLGLGRVGGGKERREKQNSAVIRS